MLAWVVLAASGMAAGVLTTVAGMGGGLLLLLGLSLAWGPTLALTSTAGALLIGNAHRVWLFRRRVHVPVARAFCLGAMPGALIGAVFAVAVSPIVVQALMLGLTGLAVLRAVGRMPWAPRASQLLPGGALIGVLTGAAGGAGVLSGPLLIAAGLEGEAYVATTSTVAALMHLSRMVGYGAGGLVTLTVLGYVVVLAASIITGNLAGRRLRGWTTKAPPRLIETVTLVACVTLAMAGVAR
jgi:uncharacterized membrane protein YfcA